MSKDTFQELLNSQKLPNHDNFNWCIEDIELAWDHQQKKIDELKKLTLDNQARYNGALETIKALEKKIDELEKEKLELVELGTDQFVTEKIQDLEERLKLKTTNEVNASVNADCLEGCRVKLKKAESKLKKAVETLKVYAYTANAEVNTRVARKTLEELEKGEL